MAGDDEGGHLVSGIWHWQSGESDLYRCQSAAGPVVGLLAGTGGRSGADAGLG